MKFLFWPLFFLTLTTCSSMNKKDGATSQKIIRVYYNNDNIGYMEPCGCRISPIGGLFRRWNAMQPFPKESRLFVDSGNFLFKATHPAEYLAPQWYEQARGVIEGYNILGADVVALGETEFALGISKFQELAKLANFPFISSNIVWRKNGELFAKDSVILEREGKKIGVFAIFNPAFQLPDELEARNPVETAKKQISKLRSAGVDMIVLLSHQGYDADVKLAQDVTGIDLLVGAHSQSLLQKPDVENQTLIVQLSSQGQMLGYVEYQKDSFPKKQTDFVVTELNNEFDQVPSGDASNPMKNLLSVTNLRIGEANRKLDEQIWSSEEKKKPAYETYLSCRDCHSKQAQFHDTKPHSAAFLTLVAAGQERNMECVKCHSVGLREQGGFSGIDSAFLDSSNHGIPWDKIHKGLPKTVAKKGVNYRSDHQAIRSDVAAWIATLQKSGVKKSFVTVQCENCHGAHGGHPFAVEATSTRKITSTLCLQCHTKERMPSWYEKNGTVKETLVQAALKSMTCPK